MKPDDFNEWWMPIVARLVIFGTMVLIGAALLAVLIIGGSLDLNLCPR